MKKLIFLTFLLLISCHNTTDSSTQKAKTDTIQIETKKQIVNERSTIQGKANDWQEGFGLTHNIDIDSIWNKPVRYYIENKKCSKSAIDFYFGKYKPTDEPKTEALLNLVLTQDSELRPFYRWILNKTILIEDGALGEYTGKPAREYAENFPNEFFEYMDFDKTGEKYSDWTNSILYSGFYEKDDPKKPNLIREDIVKIMSKNCNNLSPVNLERIKQFAKDCFPDSK